MKPDRAGLRAIGLAPGQMVSVNVRALSFAAPKTGKIMVHWEDEAGPRDREDLLDAGTTVVGLKFQ